MVADDPESFADLDGHATSPNANNIYDGGCNDGLGSRAGNSCQQAAQQQSQNAQAAQAQNQPFNPTITYDKNLSAKDRAAAKAVVEAGIGIINSKWSQLTGEEKSTIQNIKSIDVSGSAKRSFVDESTGKMTLAKNFAVGSSAPWLASGIAHDGLHVSLYNSGGITSSRGLQAEVKGWQLQLQLGPRFGLSKTEMDYLKSLIQNPSQLKQYIDTPP